MSVTTEKRREDPLELYVDFLNADFSTDPRPKLKKKQKLKTFLDQFTRPNRFKLSTGEPIIDPSYNWLEEAQNIQQEIRGDLFAIAACKEIPEKVFPMFERWDILVDKLNDMDFKRHWGPKFGNNGKVTYIGFSIVRNPREIWYAGLAELLEKRELKRLRFCSICHKYFAARDERQRFYPKSCKIKYDNKDAKFRVQRCRAKKKVTKVEVEEKRKREEQVRKFSEFMLLAKSHHQDIERVGQRILKLGQGDGTKGWKLIKQCEDKLKSGMSQQQVFDDLPQADKDRFSDN